MQNSEVCGGTGTNQWISPGLLQGFFPARHVFHALSCRSGAFRHGALALLLSYGCALPMEGCLFIIYEVPTGSKLLCDCLGLHPMIACEFEILIREVICNPEISQFHGDTCYYLDALWDNTSAQLKCGKNHYFYFDDFWPGISSSGFSGPGS